MPKLINEKSVENYFKIFFTVLEWIAYNDFSFFVSEKSILSLDVSFLHKVMRKDGEKTLIF